MRILGMALLSALANLLLPAGNMRRFAAPVIGLGITAAILLPAVSLFSGTRDALLPAIEMAADDVTYQNAVLDAYREKIEKSIMEKGDVTAHVTVGENYEIEKIVLSGSPDGNVMLFIQKDLGVARHAVEIR